MPDNCGFFFFFFSSKGKPLESEVDAFAAFM